MIVFGTAESDEILQTPSQLEISCPNQYPSDIYLCCHNDNDDITVATIDVQVKMKATRKIIRTYPDTARLSIIRVSYNTTSTHKNYVEFIESKENTRAFSRRKMSIASCSDELIPCSRHHCTCCSITSRSVASYSPSTGSDGDSAVHCS